jgi:putative transposase
MIACLGHKRRGIRAFGQPPIKGGVVRIVRWNMSRSISEIYLHLVWATWRREPLVTADIEREVYRCIEQQARDLRCSVLAIGGMPDHIHLAVRIPTYVDAARIAMQTKGVSSTFIRDQLRRDQLFRWQEGFAVFSFGRNQQGRIIKYITNQKQRHAAGKLWPEWEETTEAPYG